MSERLPDRVIVSRGRSANRAIPNAGSLVSPRRSVGGMIDLVKVGAGLTLIGFFAVGSVAVVLGLASLPTTPDQATAYAARAKNGLVVQGLGWILAGVGLSMALFGSAKSDTAVDTKLEILLERVPRPSEVSLLWSRAKTAWVLTSPGVPAMSSWFVLEGS